MNRKHFFDLLITTLAVGIGVTTANPIVGTIIGGIGVEWAATWSQTAWEQIRNRWLTPEGLLNPDLAKAFARAIEKAFNPATLVTEFQATSNYKKLAHTRPEVAQKSVETLKLLSEDLKNSLREPLPCLNSALNDLDPLLFLTSSEIQTLLENHLAKYSDPK